MADTTVYGLGFTVDGDGNVVFGGGRITINNGVNDDGIVFGSLGTADRAIDFSGSGLTGGDNWIYGDADNFWSANGFLRVSFGIQLKTGGTTGVFSFDTGSNDSAIQYDTAKDQMLFFLGSNHGRQLVFGDYASRNMDFDHATPTNPTVFIHSVTTPDSDNTEWISLTHDQTDGVIDCGKGTLNLGATGNVNFAGASVTASTVTHDEYVELEVAGVVKKFMLGS